MDLTRENPIKSLVIRIHYHFTQVITDQLIVETHSYLPLIREQPQQLDSDL